MKKNKKYIVLLLVICSVVLICGIFFFIKRNSVLNENIVTRYEWLKMLGEQVGIDEYTNESPSSNFDGEKYATGEFIGLTAMKAIGESKLQIYLNENNTITDDVYIQLALEHGLVEKEKLQKGFSKEECEQTLEVLQDLYFGEFWKDDYINAVYQDGVVELSLEDVLQTNIDCSKIVVTDKMTNSCEIGDIIVFEQENTKLKFARKIIGISSDGTLSLSTVDLDKVVKSLTMSDITELTFEDIINYYCLEKNTNVINNLMFRQKNINRVNTDVFSTDINRKGYKLSVSTKGEGKERHIEIQATDNATGISYILPISEKVKEDDEYSVEINIDNIYIGGQVDYSLLDGVKYAEAVVDAHATFTSTIKAEKEKKILLFKTPVPLGNGFVGADIQIYIVLSVDGSISFEAELPVEVSVSYEKGRGLKNFKHNISVEEPMVEANCNAGVMLRIEPTFVILDCLNVMDAEVDIGASASAKVVTRSNSQICADISVSFPVMTVSVCGDDDADTIIGDLGLSAKWEIISSDNAPIHIAFHYELLPDQTTQFGEKCTYEEQEIDLSDGSSEFVKYSTSELPIYLWINTPFEDSGECYTVKGNLQISYSVLIKDFNQLRIGDHFTVLDKEFMRV